MDHVDRVSEGGREQAPTSSTPATKKMLFIFFFGQDGRQKGVYGRGEKRAFEDD